MACEVTAALEHEIIDNRPLLVRQGEHHAIERRLDAVEIDRAIELNPRPNLADSWQRRERLDFRERRFFNVDPEIGHPALAIIIVLGPIQVRKRRAHVDERHHPDRHEAGDCQDQPLRGEQFAHQFAIEDFHRWIRRSRDNAFDARIRSV